MPNPYVNKVVQSNGTTLIDISDTTAVAADVASGKYFYLATGEKVAGSGSGGSSGYTRTVIIPEQTVPASGNQWALIASDANLIEGNEYIVTVNGAEKISTATKNGSIVYISFIDWDWNSSGYAFGTEPPYSGVYFRAITDGNYTVKVEKLELTGSGGGGGSAWTKVAETSYQVSTTSTYNVTLRTGNTDIWTSDKLLYIRIRDTAGPRSGYFYGSDNFVPNFKALSGSETATTNILKNCYKYSSGAYSTFSNSYGGRVTNVDSSGDITIPFRYSSSYSGTINGIYSIQVYLLDMPSGITIFE